MAALRSIVGAIFLTSCSCLFTPAPPRTARSRRRVLAEPEHEVELAHSIEALLQPGGGDSTYSGIESLFSAPVQLVDDTDETPPEVEALLQGSADAPWDLEEAAAEAEEAHAADDAPEFELPALEREILVDDGDLLREVDQDSHLWKTLDALPVLADPILAAVAPKLAVEADEDAITRRKVRARALPLFVVWLAAPTLSLIDTAVVGRFAPAVAVAALAPAVSFSDSLAYLMSFLAIVTTSRVAAGVAHHDGRGARLAAREGLALSLLVGAALAAAGELGGAAATLERVYVTGRTAAVLGPATTYCRIRGAALPLSLAWQTAQAASIARGDAGAPLRACAWAALVNVLGDLLLVAGLGLGVAGAAAATAVASAVGCFVQLRALARLERAERVAEAVGVGEQPEPRLGFKSLGRLFADALPFFSTLLSKTVVGVVLVAAVAGASLTELAAHQVATGLWLLLSPFSDALAAAAQSLAPRALRRAKQRPRRVLATVMTETAWAGAIGGAVAGGLALRGGGLFTADAGVRGFLPQCALPMALSLGTYVCNTVLEGTLFAFGHARPIGLTMPANALAFALAALSPAVRGSPAHALRRSWWLFVAYQVARGPQLLWFARTRDEPLEAFGAPDEDELDVALPLPALPEEVEDAAAVPALA